MDTKELGKILQAADRRNAIRECVTWLAQHTGEYKPEALAGMMANDLLGDDQP
jgi:hypothetical protein